MLANIIDTLQVLNWHFVNANSQKPLSKKYQPRPIERPERIEDRAPLSREDFEKQYRKIEMLKEIYE